MNLFTDDHPETTLHGLSFKNPNCAYASIKKIESYFNKKLKNQKIPGETEKLRPKKYLTTKLEAKSYYRNQKMTRVLSLYNRGRSVYKKTMDPVKKVNLKESIGIFRSWIDENKK